MDIKDKNKIPLVITMAWRNIKRNRLRTFLSGGTIFFVSFFICFIMAVEYGAIDDMKWNIIHHETGVIRLRNPEYTKNERITPLSLNINNTREVISAVKQIQGVTGAEPKIKAPVVLYRNGETNPATILGQNFDSGYYFADKDNLILDGNLPEVTDSASGENDNRAVITETLSKKYSLSAGDKITFIAQTARGGTNGFTATVAAVARFSDGDYNGDYIFMDFNTVSNILRMNGNGVEIMVFTRDWQDNSLTEKIAGNIKKLPEAAPLEVMVWNQGNTFYSLLEFADIMYFVYALIFFLLASTIIFNSTMMGVLERKKEIGTLLSLGMTPGGVQGMILLETVFISGISALAGNLLGALLVKITGITGINLAATAYGNMEGFNLKLMLYPAMSPGKYAEFFLTAFLTAVAACYFPSRLARKVQPADALRAEN